VTYKEYHDPPKIAKWAMSAISPIRGFAFFAFDVAQALLPVHKPGFRNRHPRRHTIPRSSA